MVTGLLLWCAAGGVALAGYGDANNGLPTPAGRAAHVWTNAVRVAPEAFAAEYPCWFGGFDADEQAPKSALLLNLDLTAAAQSHATDMRAADYFEHDSADGTAWNDRVWSYYEGTGIGENIAMGYAEADDVVVNGWMCSPDHRENLQSTKFDELGTAEDGGYWVQDFGQSEIAPRAIASGVHAPLRPGSAASFLVTWDSSAPPFGLVAVVDGVALPVRLFAGTPERGLYVVKTQLSQDTCHAYWFEGEDASGAVIRFPEDGMYGFGPCAWDDAGAQWLAARTAAVSASTSTTSDAPAAAHGCDQAAPRASAGLIGFGVLAILAGRQRRRGA